MGKDSIYIDHINISKTWANIFRLLKRTKLTRADLSRIFRISPQAVSKKFKTYSLPTLQQLVLLSELFEKPIEEILVMDNIEEKDKIFIDLFKKAHEENEIAKKVLKDSVYEDELYDETLDKLEFEIENDFTDFYGFLKITNISICMCAKNNSLFYSSGMSIDDGIGKIYLYEYGKKYDLRVPGFEKWYNEYLENWDESKMNFKKGFDINKWNSEAIRLIKEMYKVLPDSISIEYNTPEYIGEDNLTYYGSYLVPRD